ncbi:MAG TPA: hypothetical protein VLV49_18705 [Terriglobales bacterium]|nr:hypothetical protein [Terriglobales bacterium]
MACPYFVPAQRLESGTWPHPSRLPLGAGWAGCCSAPGHEGVEPTETELRELCNLGYAKQCPRLPAQRNFDAVRFAIAREGGSQVVVSFACEKAHRPAAHGSLEYDILLARWISPPSDPRIQKLAECYLKSYLERKMRFAAASPNP